MSKLRVFYGFSKITKVVKKRELAVYFENEWAASNEDWIARRCNIAAVRNQTRKEAEDGEKENRRFTKYSMFIDDKRYKGDIEAVLQCNFEADKNNVHDVEREEIRTKLREKYRVLAY